MGTTLEILAPYLAHGIECEFTHRPNDFGQSVTERQVVACLAADGDILFRGGARLTVEDVLPVLRSFAGLREYMADGVLLPVLLAQLLVNDWASQYRYEARATALGGISVDVFGLVGYMDEEEQQEFVVNLYSDWDWEVLRIVGEEEEYACAHNPAEVVDCLRKYHFAVGLDESLYIRKEVARG